MRIRPIVQALSLALIGSIGLVGCQAFVNDRYANSLLPDQGVKRLTGLKGTASIRRNHLGMPLIESASFHDAVFAMGYVHAADRLSQMLSMRALALGRLAEVHGPNLLATDRFMRAVDLKSQAQTLYQSASPRLQEMFDVYARGVNAYVYEYRNKLPLDVQGQKLEYWHAQDSALIFALVSFSLAVNLQEELGAITLAQTVGAEKLPWLLPTYPDEPLPELEAHKLKGIHLKGTVAGFAQLQEATAQVAQLASLGVAASNNWAVAPHKSRHGKSLFANDTHLPLSQPSLWNFMHIRSDRYQAAGVSIAGIPAIVAGYNGHLAWGMTMVMGDTQDLYLERVKRQGEDIYYQANGTWQPASRRYETFFIKGQAPVREALYQTRNGPLLNDALKPTLMQPQTVTSSMGLALKTPNLKGDQSLDALFNLSRAKNVEQAFDASREIRAIPLNMVFSDPKEIGWQVTGRYPNRLNGIGLIPSPGWTDDYQWDGYADPMLHPYDQAPYAGWLGTANQRTVPKGYGMQLSNSWYAPERYERMSELLEQGKHDVRTLQAIQQDQKSLFAAKLKAMLQGPMMEQPLKAAIEKLPAPERAKAQEAYQALMRFDGNMSASSKDAAIYSAFLHASARAIFADELGENTEAWNALVTISGLSYSAQEDHLLARDDSPFFDDIRTPETEDKPHILAKSLSAAISHLEKALGHERGAWQWGRLHTYMWQSDASKIAPLLNATERSKINALKSYFDRGPFAAGGDHSTLNTSTYRLGESFQTQVIPAMRITIDFSLAEPMQGINSSGQSGNPASPHYADGTDAWRNGRYASFPFKAENLSKVYGNQKLTLIPAR